MAIQFKIRQCQEFIMPTGGIALVGNILSDNNGFDKFNNITNMKTKKGWISNRDIVIASVGLLSLGHSDYADIEDFRNDPLFAVALNLDRIPSEETLRQRISEIAQFSENQKLCDNVNAELLKKVPAFGEITIGGKSYIPVDIDVSVLLNPGCHKEGICRTYHKIDGYAPIFAYIGTNGYMLANELRVGSQHSASGATEFVKRCLDIISKIGIGLDKILIRMDSGHDDMKFIKVLNSYGVKFIIKRNLRREPHDCYLELGKLFGKKQQSREGKDVWFYTMNNIPAELRANMSAQIQDTVSGKINMIVSATERFTNVKTGETFLIPEIEIASWWTNIRCTETECINAYHEHGTSEQFHSELKSDMGIEQLPSSKFNTNALILNLAAIAFNCLRLIGEKFMEKPKYHFRDYKVVRRRLRSIMQDLIYIACKFVKHAGQTWLVFGKNCQHFNSWVDIYLRC